MLACSDTSHSGLAVPAPTSTPESQSNDEWMSNRSLHSSISSPYFFASHVCQAHPSPAIIPQLSVHTTKNSPLLQKEIDAGGGRTKQQRHKLSNCEGRAWTQGSERSKLSFCLWVSVWESLWYIHFLFALSWLSPCLQIVKAAVLLCAISKIKLYRFLHNHYLNTVSSPNTQCSPHHPVCRWP